MPSPRTTLAPTDTSRHEAKDLQALQKADFNWALHLQSVWQDQPHHIDGLQQRVSDDFKHKLAELKSDRRHASPLGWVITGVGGVGKTHLLGRLRAETIRQKCAFVLVDMTDVRDFWETVSIGYTSSLQEEHASGWTQIQFVVRELIAGMSKPDKTNDNLRAITHAEPAKLKRCNQEILNALANRHRKSRHLVANYQDTVRALVATNSEDFELSNLGQIYLQGCRLDQDDTQRLGLKTDRQPPARTVEALSWVISLSMPTVVAFDQLDPIVRQLDYEAVIGESEENAEQEAVANSIILGIGDGLRSMYDKTFRTLPLLSCLESSWNILQNRVLTTSVDRFEEPRVLRQLESSKHFSSLIEGRMRPAAESVRYELPYSSWPFHPEAFSDLSNVTPRELLKLCQQHRKRCLDDRQVTELTSFPHEVDDRDRPIENQVSALETLDRQFQQQRQEVDLRELTNERSGDESLAAVLVSVCECFLREISLPDDIHAAIDTRFTGAKSTRPLHARIRLVMHSEQEREEHYSLRSLQRNHARAFQNRLKLAQTQSGIDQSLSFRHLTLLRSHPLPSGSVTQRLVNEFQAAGGQFCNPGEEELRTFFTLHQLAAEQDERWTDWLASRRPVSQTQFGRIAFAALIDRFARPKPEDSAASELQLAAQPSVGDTKTERSIGPVTNDAAENDPVSIRPQSEPASSKPKFDQRSAANETNRTSDGDSDRSMAHLEEQTLPLGRKLVAGKPADWLSMDIGLLRKHAVVLAGAGSGKTVLLKRMIEEASLRGIPSIILDGANDMSSLGDVWPTPPDTWTTEDAELARQYRQRVEPVIWTPGRRNGNPLRLELIPDLSATCSDPDEFDAAVAMVSGSLAELLKLGTSKSDENRKGILSKSLRFYLQQPSWGLAGFVELLSDLPDDARLGIAKELAIAKELSDRLRVLEETDPMIGSSGEPLDPAVLFGDERPRETTRLSIINFSFLATDEAQQRFVNQLATTLFAWIKNFPKITDRPLRGLLVIDEAKDLVPSRKSTACKESLMRLTAQARKYQLGLVYATQNPREIENTIIGNCSTQYYGKASAPASIATIREQISQRGGDANDIGHLPRGTFYVFNADAKLARPVKVQVPMCLSHHNTLDPDSVLQRANESRP